MLIRQSLWPEDPQGLRECKPDYEHIIARTRARLHNNLSLQNAIFSYFNDQQLEGSIAELIGELVSEARWLERNIQKYIDEQEGES